MGRATLAVGRFDRQACTPTGIHSREGHVLKKLVVLAAVVVALIAVGRASADPLVYGVADDYPVFHTCGDAWWSSAKDIGYTELRMTVQWQGNNAIPNQANLAAAVLCARLNNITPVLAIYPARPSLIGSSDSAQQSFAGFAALVAQAFPTREELHRRQRAERQPLLAAAVHERPGRGGQGLRAHARVLLRHDQGRPPRRNRLGPGDLLARQRQRDRRVEPVALAGVVHRRHGGRVQGVGTDEADLRRLQHASVPAGPGHGSLLEGVPVAAGRRCEPRPREAGAVGRLQRHLAADPAEQAGGRTAQSARNARFTSGRSSDRARRGRRADERHADEPCGRLHQRRCGERHRNRRDDAGAALHASSPRWLRATPTSSRSSTSR